MARRGMFSLRQSKEGRRRKKKRPMGPIGILCKRVLVSRVAEIVQQIERRAFISFCDVSDRETMGTVSGSLSLLLNQSAFASYALNCYPIAATGYDAAQGRKKKKKNLNDLFSRPY